MPVGAATSLQSLLDRKRFAGCFGKFQKTEIPIHRFRQAGAGCFFSRFGLYAANGATGFSGGAVSFSVGVLMILYCFIIIKGDYYLLQKFGFLLQNSGMLL